MYIVDKHIPLPPLTATKKAPIPFELLAEPGDSFFILERDNKMANVKMAASRYGRKNDITLSVYTERNGCRVFRR